MNYKCNSCGKKLANPIPFCADCHFRKWHVGVSFSRDSIVYDLFLDDDPEFSDAEMYQIERGLQELIDKQAGNMLELVVRNILDDRENDNETRN